MNVEIRALDITQFKGDAIVNSLGVGKNIRVFGKICSNIIKAANSKKLIDDIFSFEREAEPCKVFVTSGYNLPSPHIINVITPCFSHDQQLYALEYVYKQVLLTAYENGWNNVALPIIGTGANGYPHAYVLKMISKLANAFVRIHDNMNITLCVPVVSEEVYEQNVNPKELEKSIKQFFAKNEKLNIREFEYDEESFESIDSLTIETYLEHPGELRSECKRAPRCYDEAISTICDKSVSFIDEIDVLLENGKRPARVDMQSLGLLSITNYIETYIDNRYVNESDKKLIKKYVAERVGGEDNKTSIKSKHNNEEKRTTISLSMLMRYILALHMSKQEADDLLLFCGRAFSPIGKEDIIYQSLIKLKKYDPYEVNGLCLSKKINPIFAYLEN